MKLDDAIAQLEQLAEAQRRDFVRPRIPARILIEDLNIPRSNLDNWNARKVFNLDADLNREGDKSRLYSARDSLVLKTANEVSGLGVPLAVGQTLGRLLAEYVMHGMGRVTAFASRATRGDDRTSVMLFRHDGKWQMIHYRPGNPEGPRMQFEQDQWKLVQGEYWALKNPPPVRIEIEVDDFIRDVLEATQPGAVVSVGNVDDLTRAAEKLRPAGKRSQ